MNATRGTEKWECDFVLALRVRDVPGEAIGAALAEVQAHCADTGQTPAEVFGPPLAYAVSLALPENAPRRARTLGTTALTLLGVLGLWVLPPAAGAWLRGESYAVSHGSLVGAAVLAVVVAVVAAPMALGWLSRLPRPRVRRARGRLPRRGPAQRPVAIDRRHHEPGLARRRGSARGGGCGIRADPDQRRGARRPAR